MLRLGSKEIDVINNSCIYDAYKDLYLSEKEREERLLEGTQSANGLKERLGAKKSDGTALTLTPQENVIKKTCNKRFAIPFNFEFFKHPVYSYGLKEDLSVTIALTSAKEVILCTGDTNAISKISDIILEYDAIFDDPYATSLGGMYIREMSIPYTKVTSIHYQALSKKAIVWRIDLNNLSARSLRSLLLLFLDKHDDFANKNEEFYNPNIKNILVTINGMPHQLYAGGLGARDIYPELKNYFYKENSDVTCEEFLSTKFGLWIDTRSSIDNTLHGNGRVVDKGMVLQIKKAAQVSGGDLMCYIFSLEDAVVHLNVTDPGGILAIENYVNRGWPRPKDQQNKTVPCNFIALKRAINFVAYHSLIHFL